MSELKQQRLLQNKEVLFEAIRADQLQTCPVEGELALSWQQGAPSYCRAVPADRPFAAGSWRLQPPSCWCIQSPETEELRVQHWLNSSAGGCKTRHSLLTLTRSCDEETGTLFTNSLLTNWMKSEKWEMTANWSSLWLNLLCPTVTASCRWVTTYFSTRIL